MTGTVYTETTVYAAPEAFVAEAPYQIAIVTLNSGERVTGRVGGDHVAIEDKVTVVQEQNGVPFFQKAS